MTNLQSGLPVRFKRLYYHKEKGTMFAKYLWGFSHDTKSWLDPSTMLGTGIDREAIVMFDIQSTGLTDKLGVELFDGDLLKSIRSDAVVCLRWNKSNMAFNLHRWAVGKKSQPLMVRKIDQQLYVKTGNIFEVANGYKL